ncbi:glycoside hydrolase domain-containing protein [Streptomyces sp. NPDC093249]|uniref:glycoside hydrolase domain-containing protein n=1 Tax=unclassified Streptomyces TaxID=2593676 RepID=UPI00380835E3
MADEMVLRAQRFINLTYMDGSLLGIPKLEENGRTGWTVMYALTRALQYEMNISPLSNSFGPTTLSTLQTKYGQVDENTVPSGNFCRIIQSALYCKGYDGGEIDGQYNARVKAAVAQLKDHMGVAHAFPGTGLQPKVIKGLFNMDAYVSVGNGSDTVRAIQRWLNGQYVQRKDFYVIPCDGHHSRDVAKSMLFAIQYELGMADGVANGAFGPGTQAGLRTRTLDVGSTGVWVRLFTAAMELNKRPTSFTDGFTSSVATAVRAFQEFMQLDVTGRGDFRTWASLLVSYGDQTRPGTACDGVTKITPARAQTLKDAGYLYIGRYLYNPGTSLPEKEIQPGELDTIKAYGLRCFPIYQTWARSVDYYSPDQGFTDVMTAVYKAQEHGFKNGARIYFAVDYDAVDDEVTSKILPYFENVRATMTRLGSPYKIGVYGPRNVCARVTGKNHADSCFVSDMSSGFSGNLGYPMPDKWAFDQIATKTIGTGAGAIEIDNNIATGWDTGQGDFLPRPSLKQDIGFNLSYWDALLSEIQAYMASIGRPGGPRIYTVEQCLREVMIARDNTISSTSRMFRMRKALVQTSAFWEFCHYGPKDLVEDAGVYYYHTGVVPDWAKDLPGVSMFVDSSTGVAKISGRTCILARNNAINAGLLEGELMQHLDPGHRWTMWQKSNQDNAFNVGMVPYMHIWGADGKAGDVKEETPMRRPALDYTAAETSEILRRYQGSGDEAVADNALRQPLYAIFEKYNRVIRES